MSQLISAHQLSHSFASRTLFKDVSLGVFEGDRIGLVGPNGAGKSTLMKILHKSLAPDQGTVTYRRGLNVGYLPQSPSFKPEETLYEAIVSKANDAHEVMAEAYMWMSKLGLDKFSPETPANQLSGGWKKRLALGRELVLEPELLLLDEPTNHLDIESILWLEEFIAESPMAILTITHDRLFLQRVANKIFDLDPKNPNFLLNINGDYISYLEAKELMIAGQEHREWTMKNTLRRETEWLRRGAKARQTKQKSRIERALDLKEEVSELSGKNRKRSVKMDFGEGERNPKKLIDAKNISKSYPIETGEDAGQTKILFTDFSTLIGPNTRMGLIGPNGAGKSSLIRTLLKREEPDSGTVEIADSIKISYFEQNRESLNPRLSLIRNICPQGDYVNYLGQFIYAKSYLERFLFSPQQMDLPVERLSGGEQSRLRIAQLMLETAAVLVLDEPTNDLDLDTLNILEESLQEFPGAVILVTHDRYFMDQVATEIVAFPMAANSSGKLERFADYLQWEAWQSGQGSGPLVDAKSTKASASTTAAANLSSAAGGKGQKLSYKEKLEFEQMEAKIQVLEQEMGVLEKEVNTPEIAANATKVQAIYSQIHDKQKIIESLYQRWGILEKKSAPI